MAKNISAEYMMVSNKISLDAAITEYIKDHPDTVEKIVKNGEDKTLSNLIAAAVRYGRAYQSNHSTIQNNK